MRMIDAKEVEVMVVEVCRYWRRLTRSGIGTLTRLCGGSSAVASVALPWVVSMASVAPVVDDVAAAVGVAVVVIVAAVEVAVVVDGAAVEEMYPSN